MPDQIELSPGELLQALQRLYPEQFKAVVDSLLAAHQIERQTAVSEQPAEFDAGTKGH